TTFLNNTMKPLMNGSFSFCSLDGVTRNHSSVFYAVTISASVIIGILSPVAVIGNALIMAAIWKNPSLRTPSYTLLRALAFTDLCTGLITQPFYVAAELICLESPQNINKQLPFLLPAVGISAGCGVYFTSLSLTLITLMSIERWLHMSRRALLSVRRSYFIATVAPLFLIPVGVFTVLYVLKKTYRLVLSITLFVLLPICIISTSIAYFKVFKIIRRHQRQIQTNELANNFSHPSINLQKYKRSVFSMLYILGASYISFLPLLLFVGLSFWLNFSQIELLYIVSLMFLFSTSSLNPLIYLWRMNDIRNGVKQLLKQLLCKDN
ncbi:uncharacterized protein LOC144629472, partial [Oculina patagonica]